MVMDGEFEPLCTDLKLLGIELNTTSRDEHVPEIERQIRVIKERIRACLNSLPFKCLPKIILVDMLYTRVFWLNAFPPKGGTSPTISPCTLLTGVKIDFKIHCKLSFGAYAQVHHEEMPRNSPRLHSTGAICLRPNNNLQGGYKFMSLVTGCKIDHRSWTELPMLQEVIERVNQLGRAEGQPEQLTFYDR